MHFLFKCRKHNITIHLTTIYLPLFSSHIHKLRERPQISCFPTPSVPLNTSPCSENTKLHLSVFNLLILRANLRLSYNPAGRSNCRLQNHHGYIKHHHRGMDGSPGDVGEVPMMYVMQRKGCRMICDVGKSAEGLENEL